MAEYIELEAALSRCGWYNTANGKSICAARKDELVALPSADVVSRAAYDQAVWERDVAMKQLEGCGIPFGGKVDVAPVVRGLWKHGKDHGDFYEAECTACGGILLVDWNDGLSEYRYCPNCGAKMGGRVDDESH